MKVERGSIMKKRKLGVKYCLCILAVVLVILAIGINKYEFNKSSGNKEISEQTSVESHNEKEYDEQLTMEEKLEDFQYMYNILAENYPYFEVNKRVNGIDWLSKKEEFQKEIEETKNDNDFYSTMSAMLELLHNGHTNFISEKSYPNQFKSYNDQFSKPWREIVQKSEVMKRYNYKVNKDDTSGEKSNGNTNDLPKGPVCFKTDIIVPHKVAYLQVKSFNLFSINSDKRGIYKFLDEIKDYSNLIIDIRGNGGGSENYWMENIVAPLTDKELSAEYYYLFREGEYISKFLEARKINMMDINNLNKEIVDTFPPEVKNDFKYHNFFKIVKPQNKVGFKGKIYLLVDKRVYSSSEAFASFCKATKWATLVGERTGGDGIGIDPMLMELPNSHYLIRFSGIMGLSPDGSVNEEKQTEPDIQVVNPTRNESNGYEHDKAIQEVLKNID